MRRTERTIKEFGDHLNGIHEIYVLENKRNGRLEYGSSQSQNFHFRFPGSSRSKAMAAALRPPKREVWAWVCQGGGTMRDCASTLPMRTCPWLGRAESQTALPGR